MTALSNYAEGKLADHLLGVTAFTMPTGVYIKLHLADPGEDCTANPAVETDRAAATFGANSAGVSSNTTLIEWLAVSTTETYSHWSAWDASTLGNPLVYGALTASVAVTAGDDFEIPIGDLDVTFA